MPGSSPTMARREPTSRLNSVDLPTLGRPTMASGPASVGVAAIVRIGCVRYLRLRAAIGTRARSAASGRNVYYRDSRASRRVFSASNPRLPRPAAARFAATNSSGPEACSRRRIPRTSFAAGNCRWPQAVEQALKKSAT